MRTLLFALAFLVGCAPQATLPPETFDPVKIAVVTSLSGTLATDGPGWEDAARMAAREINAAGGPLPGRPIELIVFDDETNPENGPALAEQIIAADVAGIIGPPASSVTLAIAQATVPAQIPQISCCATSDLITSFNENTAEEDRYLFRTAPPDSLQAIVVAEAAVELECTRLAILHLDDDYGEPFGLGIEQAFRARGGTVAVRVPFVDELPSYAAEVTRVRDAMPDCIALVAFPVSGGQIVRDWANLTSPPDVKWIGTDGVRAPGFVEEAGDPALIDGFYGASPVVDPATPAYNDFASRFEAVFGYAPIPFSSNQYDAMALLGLAIARAGTTDGPAVRDALREVASPPATRGVVRAGQLADGIADIRAGRDVDYDGASGDTNFDEYGNVVTQYEIWRYDAPGTTPCPRAQILPRGSFCRYRVFNAEEIRP